MSEDGDRPAGASADHPPGYFDGINEALFRAVPNTALRILDVGCANGRLGAALKQLGPPGRQVFGVERDAAAAAGAAQRLDAVYTLDATRGEPPLDPGSLDCILFGDVLGHFPDPLTVLRHYRPLLQPEGSVLCSIPNLQHHSVLSAILANDFQYQRAGLLDSDHIRFFTASTIFKMLLDAGFLPRIVQATTQPCPPELLESFAAASRHLRLDRDRLQFLLSVFQFIVDGRMLPPVLADDEPMTIVACINDEAQFANNLAASPCVRSGRHELLQVRNAASAADGINAGLAAARHRLVAIVHQDVYLPQGWPARLQHALRAAERQFGPVGVAGLVGIARTGMQHVVAGRVVDRLNLIAPEVATPIPAVGLDELALVVPKDGPVRFDPRLGWHNYGTDAVMQANAHGLHAAILDAPVLHNSRGANILYQDFIDSMQVLASKWRDCWPLENMVMRVAEDGRLLFKWPVSPDAGARPQVS